MAFEIRVLRHGDEEILANIGDEAFDKTVDRI
jgi:hypothetical protein